jgi:hypothetical protein
MPSPRAIGSGGTASSRMLCVHGCHTWRLLRCCHSAFLDGAGVGQEVIVGGIRVILWGKARDRIDGHQPRQTAKSDA